MLGLDEIDVRLGAAGRDVHRLGAVKIVAGRPDRDRIATGVEPIRREAVCPFASVTTVTVTVEPSFLALTNTAFHGAFLDRRHLSVNAAAFAPAHLRIGRPDDKAEQAGAGQSERCFSRMVLSRGMRMPKHPQAKSIKAASARAGAGLAHFRQQVGNFAFAACAQRQPERDRDQHRPRFSACECLRPRRIMTRFSKTAS